MAASQLRKFSRAQDRHKLWLGLIALVAVAVRLIAIQQPYIDNWSWRQSDVAAIARNFFAHGFHFVWPQIDWAGDAPGYVGTEFPILPFLAALSYKICGVHEWVGRMQAVIFFVASLPFFFLLVRDMWHRLPADEKSVPLGSSPGSRCHLEIVAATWATIFYSFAPLCIVSSRAFMPDMPSLSLALIGLYFFLHYCDAIRDSRIAVERRDEVGETGPAREEEQAHPLPDDHAIRDSRIAWEPRSEFDRASPARGEERNHRSFFIASAALISLSILIKLPTALIGAPILFLAWEKWRWSFVRQPALWLYAVVALLPSAIWYWHAHRIAEQFYPHHFFGAGGIQLENFSWYMRIARQIATSSLTPLLFIAALVGMFAARGRRHAGIFYWWLAGMILFIISVGYGNRHQWYQLPLVPIAAAFGGVGCASVASQFSKNGRRALIVMSILFAGSFGLLAYKYARPLYESSATELRDLGLELKKTTPENSLIIAADNGDPTVFYYAQRRGWHFLEKEGIYDGEPTDSAQAIVDLEKLRKRGATHLVFTANTNWWLDYYQEFAQRLAQSATLMESRPEFKIYKLNPAQDRQ